MKELYPMLYTILGSLLSILGGFLQKRYSDEKETKRMLREKKAEIYIEFFRIGHQTAYLLSDLETSSEEDKKMILENNELIAKCELYLDKKLWSKIKQYITIYGKLYSKGEGKSYISQENLEDLKALHDSIIKDMRKDLGIEE